MNKNTLLLFLFCTPSLLLSMERDVRPSQIDIFKQIYEAAAEGEVQKLHALIKVGEYFNLNLAAINVLYGDGTESSQETPLHAAVRNHRFKCAQSLLEISDVNSTDIDGRTAIFYSVESDNVGITTLLIDAGSDVNAPQGIAPGSECSLLSLAVLSRSHKNFELLLGANACPDGIKSNPDDAPVLHASVCKSSYYLERLHAAGAKLTVRDSKGNTLLHRAIQKSPQCARYLLNNWESLNLNINARNAAGETALHNALDLTNPLLQKELAELLMHNGANKYLADNRGRVPAKKRGIRLERIR